MKRFAIFVFGLCLVYGKASAHEGESHVLDTSREGMKVLADALGVKCRHCHLAKTDEGKRDYKAESLLKDTALYMKHNYVDGLVTKEGKSIDCAFCHQGQAHFIVRDTTEAKPSGLAGKSRGEIVAMMKEMQKALGVKTCDYCHVRGRDGRLDSVTPTPNKTVARMMMDQFTDRLLDIKTGKPATCQMCHRGKAKFLPREE